MNMKIEAGLKVEQLLEAMNSLPKEQEIPKFYSREIALGRTVIEKRVLLLDTLSSFYSKEPEDVISTAELDFRLDVTDWKWILHDVIFRDNTYAKILTWARSRGILDKGNILVQTMKLQEEVGELSKAVLYKDQEEISDAIGDIVIVLTSLSHFNGSDIEQDVRKALEIVQQRKGKMKDGNFVKDSELKS